MSDDRWWFRSRGKESGPLDLADILEAVHRGTLAATDSVRRGELGAWRRVDSMPELFYGTAPPRSDDAPIVPADTDQSKLLVESRLPAVSRAGVESPLKSDLRSPLSNVFRRPAAREDSIADPAILSESAAAVLVLPPSERKADPQENIMESRISGPIAFHRRSGVRWLMLLVAIGAIGLYVRFLPGFWSYSWEMINYFDLRRWKWRDFIVVEVIAVVILVGLTIRGRWQRCK